MVLWRKIAVAIAFGLCSQISFAQDKASKEAKSGLTNEPTTHFEHLYPKIPLIHSSDSIYLAKKVVDDPQKKQKFVKDSLYALGNYHLAIDLFGGFFKQYISPISLQKFTDELCVSAAQEDIEIEVNKDFFYTSDQKIQSEDVNYEHIPMVSDDIIRDRMSCIKTQFPMNFNEDVREWIDYMSVKRRKYSLTILKRKNLYFPLFEKYLAEYGLPDELKYLAIVESALKPSVYSHAGAAGLWQFMPSTGRLYGLDRNNLIDERLDPEKSTIAACKYLKSLYEFNNQNWELALASYNCGPGRVQKAVRKTGKTDFWEVYNNLPKETRAYVPMFIAVTYVMHYAEEHNLIQNKPEFPIESTKILVNQGTTLKNIAKELKVCEDDLAELNPELIKKTVPKNYVLNIPSARMNIAETLAMFSKKEDQLLASNDNYEKMLLTSATPSLSKKEKKAKKELAQKAEAPTKSVENAVKEHKVKRGESLNMIAKRYKTTIQEIKEWNNLSSNKIHAGQKLAVKKLENSPEKLVASTKKTETKPENVILLTKNLPEKPTLEKIAPASKKAKTENKTTNVVSKDKNNDKYHVVRNGDSLWTIASKHGLTVDKIKKINNISTNKLKIGQKLKVGA